MSKRYYVGKATTDENGEATFKYKGTGAGKVNFIAECEDLTANKEILDCLVYDAGTQNNPNVWNETQDGTSGVNKQVSWGNDGTTINYQTTTANNRKYLYYVKKQLSGNFEITFTCKNNLNKSVYINLSNKVNLSDMGNRSGIKIAYTNDDNYYDWRIRRLGNIITFEKKLTDSESEEWVSAEDDIMWNSLATENCYFGFYFYSTEETTRKLIFRDLKIYPIYEGN